MTDDGILRFSASDVERWARFSGDSNPVHLNDGFARSLGLLGRIVPGMLAMLELKRRIDALATLDRGERGGWWSCECRLRSPIPLDATARFRAGARRGGHSFVLDVRDGPGAISGVLRAVDLETRRNEATATGRSAFALTEAQVRDRLDDLWLAGFSADPAWVAADALVFSTVMAPSPGPAFQTGQDVAFDSDFFGAAGEAFTPRPLEIDALEAESRTTAGAAHLTRRWQARHRDRVVIKMEIRLMLLPHRFLAPECPP